MPLQLGSQLVEQLVKRIRMGAIAVQVRLLHLAVKSKTFANKAAQQIVPEAS
jgi:hypothetical protein